VTGRAAARGDEIPHAGEMNPSGLRITAGVTTGWQRRAALGLVCLLWGAGCGQEDGEEADEAPAAGGADAAPTGTGGAPPASSGAIGGSSTSVLLATGGAEATPDLAEGGAATCAATHAQATLRPVRLAFLLDVSGSMGKLDHPWHDPALKWEPVVAGTEAFFGAPAAAGIEATLTFFPAEDDRCDTESYLTPDVPLTALPSPLFAEAIAAVTPASEDEWRGGTPTLAALGGVISALRPTAEAEPDVAHAIVLVTDGHPQDCDDDSIESVAAAAAAVADLLPTFVIGVKNPPLEDAPDTVSDLGAIAVAGGTGAAFLIDTGDPAATTSELLAVIDGIRGAALACDLTLPPPPAGQTLDPRRVRVTYTSGTTALELGYDATCADANGWHYDDPAAPTTIHLCEGACATVQQDPAASLDVEFACTIVNPVLR